MTASASPTKRRRQRVHPNTMARMRVAVHERDGYACLHCGWAPPSIPANYDGRYALGISYEKPNGDYGCRLLELDHVFPALLGGRFEYDNLQTLCNSCNVRKGARV